MTQMDQSGLSNIPESMLSQRKNFLLMLGMRDSWDLKSFFIQRLVFFFFLDGIVLKYSAEIISQP